jgi:hypothetical protein
MSRTLIVSLVLVVAGTALAGTPRRGADPFAVGGPEGPPPVGADGPRGPHGKEFAEKEAQILERLKAEDPERYEQLIGIKADYPEVYPMVLRKFAHRSEPKEKDPETAAKVERLHEIKRELREMARDFDALSAKEQKARRAEMEDLAHEAFDLHGEVHRARIAGMKAQLAEHERELADREKKRDEIVSEHLDRLIEGPAEL